MKKLLFILLCAPLIGLTQTKDTVILKESAIESAEGWLLEIDKINYQWSYENADELMRNAITSKEWYKIINYARDPLGKIISRELVMSRYFMELPGAPDGDYVITLFSTSFENKKSSIERVVTKLGDDNVWRVGGYFIE